MENKNKIFKKIFIYEYTTTMSYGIPCIISYIFWTIQVLNQSNTLKKKLIMIFMKVRKIKMIFLDICIAGLIAGIIKFSLFYVSY